MMAQSAVAESLSNEVYALLSLSGRYLLLPQSDIGSLESCLDIIDTDKPANGIGWIQFRGGQWPVYELSNDFSPLRTLSPEQRICVLLKNGDGYFGLACSNFATLTSAEIRLQTLPEAMITPGSPVCGLFVYQDKVEIMSTASALEAYW